jgi:hypothetical protein
MDPFVLLDQAVTHGKIKPGLANKVKARGRYLVGAVERVERACGMRYPRYYVEPTLPVAVAAGEVGGVGALYARVIPAVYEGKLSILVQFTAPLVLHGAKGTVEAVAGHEFTHYVDLVRRLSTMSVVSDEKVSTLFEAGYADEERVVQPGKIFAKDRALASLIRRKFTPNLTDPKLDEKVAKKWIEAGLPTRRVAPEENTIRLDAQAVAGASFDPLVLEWLRGIGKGA